ncbi:MAG: hypothetical protein DDT31_01718 [Syntrophomonadaceae bacterium]|nr:hypothetical protein [Bacillota bacterium]
MIDGVLTPTKFDLFNIFATNLIYRDSQYIQRLKRINFFNTPNIIYNISALKDRTVIEFIERFSVTEDYPLQIKMAEIFTPMRLCQVDKVLVYYRRTNNSTYIIKSTVFSKDKIEIFKYLIGTNQSHFERILIRNRLFCYELRLKIPRIILNLNYYLYGIRLLTNAKSIIKRYRSFDPEIKRHQNHFDLISRNAKDYLLI